MLLKFTLSADDCHWILPLDPARVITAELPLQIVEGAAVLVPPTAPVVIVMYEVKVLLVLPFGFAAIKVTGYVPAALYVITGFCSVELAGVPPGNDQVHELGEPTD